MKKNEIFTGTVVDYTHDGLGIVKLDTFPIFIEDVIVGEEIEFKIIKLKKNLGYGKLVQIITKSSERVDGISKTSGANLVHMSYNEQLRFKTNKVRNIMDKTLGKNKVKVLDILGANRPYHYRNKSVIPVQRIKNEIKMGYYKSRSHDVINVEKCYIQYDEHNKLMNDIRNLISEMNLSVYDEATHTGAIRHIMLRTNTSKTEIMVGIIAKENFNQLDNFVNKIVELDNRIVSVILNINSKKTNVIYGDTTRVLYGRNYITDKLAGIKFNISLRSFYQINPIQTIVLYKKALELAELGENDIIIDAYCGIGTITLFAAQKVKKVYGIEVIDVAIDNARENAQLNSINNVEFLLGKSEGVIKSLISQNIKIDAVIVDPPRKGCEESFLYDLASMNIKKIVYVSCNPATLARDMKILHNLGYTLGEVQPVDMFPGSYHVETVALLSKLDVDKYIDVEIKLDELDLTSAESKATYAQIKEYILEKFDLKVSTLYIAQIKKKCGIVLREHYNKSKKEKQVIPQCTPEKEAAIMDALRHFKMI
ncbi:23S rRNA (uracil(1939)-C(5))-methyltransferase RlmD [Gemella massiliensis]|uniref:23S rRNA (uracil(1939)-C(5))-methyltransferase RlmD n=1 Tax=Gemella massiliensis TaxID=1909670 RepID=UPI0009FB1040|nr:23S rRNA (uracil(1939)-C(5))-methyltransferase RlmD [Gemella massiliensis]